MDTNLYKTLLESEKSELLNDLSNISTKDPVSGNYNTVSDASDSLADDSDLDDRNEDFETDSAMTDTFSARLKEVENALSKIENGSFGVCTVCNKSIEEERLNVDPAATTCIEHLNN